MITDSQIGKQILQVLAFDHTSDQAIFLFNTKRKRYDIPFRIFFLRKRQIIPFDTVTQ